MKINDLVYSSLVLEYKEHFKNILNFHSPTGKLKDLNSEQRSHFFNHLKSSWAVEKKRRENIAG